MKNTRDDSDVRYVDDEPAPVPSISYEGWSEVLGTEITQVYAPSRVSRSDSVLTKFLVTFFCSC